MEPVLNFLGHTYTVADVYNFAFQWLFPILWGFLTSCAIWVMKRADWLAPLQRFSPQVKTWLMRGVVALCCAVVNFVGTWMLTGELSVALFQQSVVSYFAAVTAFEHATKGA
jgi:hypothetical protein